MLTVMKLPSEGLVTMHPHANLGPIIIRNEKLQEIDRIYYRCAIHLSKVPPEITTVKGRLIEGELTEWGDRSCVHSAYHGTLFVNDNFNDYDDPSMQKGHFGIGGVQYTHMCTQLSEGVLEYESYYPGSGKWKSLLRTAFQVRGTFLVSWTISGAWDANGGKRSCQVAVVRWDQNYRSGSITLYYLAMTHGEAMRFIPMTPSGGGSSVTSKGTMPSSSKSTLVDVAQLASVMLKGTSSLRSNRIASRPIDEIWGELCQRAVDSVSLTDGNLIESCSELPTFISQFYSWIPKDTKVSSLAGAQLGLQYGPLTTIREINGILSGVKRSLRADLKAQASVRSSYSESVGDYDFTYHYKVVYRRRSQEMLKMATFLNDYGLLPTLSRAWDLVPLSFAVDWFVNIGSVLDNFDFRTKSSLYNIVGVTRSQKLIRPVQTGEAGSGDSLKGHITYVSYRRETRKELDFPSLFSKSLNRKGTSHVSSLTTLTIAKSKK